MTGTANQHEDAELKVRPNRRQRVALRTFTPQWRPVYENWSRAWLRRNYWRVSQLFLSEADALQECGAIFAYCVRLYPYVDCDAWFMALFKRAVSTKWIRFSQHNQRRRIAADHAEAAVELNPTISYNDGPLMVALSQSSNELVTVLQVMAQAPSEYASAFWQASNSDMRAMLRIYGIRTRGPRLLNELRALMTGVPHDTKELFIHGTQGDRSEAGGT